MPEQTQSFKVICSGGLNSNENHLDLSDNKPGAATRLVNYEPSLFGGYRRINGFAPYNASYPEVGVGGVGTGKIYCIAIYKNEHIGNPYLIAARKNASGNTYSFWKYVDGSGWAVLNTGLTLAVTSGSRTVDKIRFVQFDFGTGSQICFVDGVNNATVFNGTNWYAINSSNSGGSSSPGGNQVVNAPELVDVFENHLFLAGDRTSKAVITHSAAKDPLTFTTAAGAGQVVTGFNVVQIKPFRDNLFVFGTNAIKSVKVVSNAFVLDNVTANVGCVARDSVLEIGGDLLFLAPDGFRPVAGTSRIGDVELETVSKPIQGALVDLIENYDLTTVNGVVIRSKSQVRYFVGGSTVPVTDSYGIIGGLSDSSGSIEWEFGELLGIRASCCTSDYIGTTEYILHGDHDGKVYRQESGNSFNGTDIVSVYQTPYLDFGETEVRKTLRKVNTFIRAEGPMTMNLSMAYDWGSGDSSRPSTYSQDSAGAPAVFAGRNITYNGANVIYGGASKPIMTSDIQGSGFSARANFVTVSQEASHTIQGIVFEFSVSGRA
jgi:hypothetical protein